MSKTRPARAGDPAADDSDAALPWHGDGMWRVVGLAGSAGAIPGLLQFLEATRPHGLAYIVVLHVAPQHDGMLAELLQRYTPMPVLQVHGPVELAADTVYVVPPRHALEMRGGSLHLGPLPMNRPGRVAVDMFFRSLADTHGSNAVAIVLSGMEDDGAIGLRRVNERGGLTIAQDPQEALHADMPRAAIATGAVDWVLPVAEMPRRLSDYMALGRGSATPFAWDDGIGDHAATAAAAEELRGALALMHARTGRDFGTYGPATVLRRIGRRMRVNGIEQLGDYVDCLRDQPGETEALLRDLLIRDTRFFRDADCFQALERELATLFDDRSPKRVMRVWVAACATGEEAYSVAMLLSQIARSKEGPPALQVFATDLDAEAIRVARAGVYPLSIAADVSEERLRRFFTREQDGYRVRRELREQVLFAVHDVLKDAPFSRIDLLVCRNLLVHLDPDAGRRVLQAAHFALSPGGRLFLGAAEDLDDDPSFQPLDSEHRLYTPRVAQRPGPPELAADVAVQRKMAATEEPPVAWQELHFKMLEALAPASILIDGEYEIRHLSPGAVRYLGFSGGEPGRHLLQAIHPTLRPALGAAILQAAQSGARAQAAPVRLALRGRTAAVRIAVAPAPDIAPGMLVVTLETLAALPLEHTGVEGQPLQARHEALQLATEQLETRHEELKSINEDLTVTNHELRGQVEELRQENRDLKELMEATDIATVVLDRALRVMRFTPAAVTLFSLIAADVGRPLADLTSQLDYPELAADAQRALQGLAPGEREVRAAGDRWYLARMHPYRSSEHRIAGAVLTLVDITDHRASREALRLSEERFGAIADQAAVGVLQSGRDGIITFANEFIRDLLGHGAHDLVGTPMLDLVHPDDRAASREKFDALTAGGSFQVEKRLLRNDGSATWVHNSVSSLPTSDHGPEAVLVVSIDVNERVDAEEALRMREERLRLILDNATEYAIFSTGLDRRVTSWNPGARRLLGWEESEIVGRPCDVLFTEEDRQADRPAREAAEALAAGRAVDERLHQRKSGDRFWASGVLMPMRDRGGEVVGFVKILHDQTAQRETLDQLAANRKELVQALEDNQAARRELESADRAKDRFLAILSHELRNPLAAIAASTELLLNEDPQGQDGRRERARTIVDNQIEAMKRQLDDMLDISRLRYGRLALRKRPATLATIIDRALETARSFIERRRQALSLLLPDAEVTLCVDPVRMSQVVSNLLVNASRVTDDGGHIALSARTELAQCVIEVRDEGRGLDEAALASMFDMSWRNSEADATGAHGAGIGLALVRSVMSLHEGSVGAVSDGPGLGSTFTIRLPVHTPAAPER